MTTTTLLTMSDRLPQCYGQASTMELVSDRLGHDFGDPRCRADEPYYANFANAGRQYHEKKIDSGLDQYHLAVSHKSADNASGPFAAEINLAMPAAYRDAVRSIFGDGSMPRRFGQSLQGASGERLLPGNAAIGRAFAIELNPPAHVAAGPHFTVSRCEAGIDKSMQASTLRLERSR